MKFAKITVKFGFAKLVGLNKKVEFGYGKEYYIPLELMKDFNSFRVNKMIEVDEKTYSESELDPKLTVFTGFKNIPVKNFINKAGVVQNEESPKTSVEPDPEVEELTKKEMIEMIMATKGHNYSQSKLNKMNKAELTSILTSLSEGNVM